MRTMTENKARTGKEACPRCDRPVGREVEQCRPGRGGWWCWRDGLIFDARQIIAPSPDALGEHEQAAMDEYAPRIAEAEKRVDELLVIHAAVEAEAHRAMEAAAEVGITSAGTVAWMAPSAERRARRPAGRDRRAAKRAVEAALSAREHSGRKLQAARAALTTLIAAQDLARRAGRDQDRGVTDDDS